MIKVDVINGIPGCGKTYAALSQIADHPGSYLFATSRIELITERIRDLKQICKAAGTDPFIAEIHSQRARASGKTSLLAEIESVPLNYKNKGHVVVLITHESMMSANLDGFAGWQILIDENPSAIASGSIAAPATATYLEQAYGLEPLADTKWARLIVKSNAPRLVDLMKDDHLSGLVVLDKRARSQQGVYVDIEDWEQVKGSRRSIKWWSAWTPMELGAFASVTMVGAGYFESLGYKATKAWFSDQVTFVEQPIASPHRASPQVRIHYFTRHKGSTAYWAGKGKDVLLRVVRFLAGVTDIGYWATNTQINDLFRASMSGLRVSPRQEGSNDLSDHTSCAFIYSAKAVPNDGPGMEAFGYDEGDVERSREIEDIIQFFMRGALRKSDFDGTYTAYLYSLDQAVALRNYLRGVGITDVHLVPVDDAHIMDVEREKRGPKKRVLDESTKAARAERKRKSDRESKADKRAQQRSEKAKAGTLRSRGRPKKDEMRAGA